MESTDPAEGVLQEVRAVKIRYTNWRGETGCRSIIPGRLVFGSNEWHPEPQWLLEAFDVEKNEIRTFAVKDIHEWIPVGSS